MNLRDAWIVARYELGEAMRTRLGIKPAGFRTPGGFADGLNGRPDVQQMLLDCGFKWASCKYPAHLYGKPGEAATREVCAATGVELANLNCPGQLVISGEADRITQACEQAKARGAKIYAELGGYGMSADAGHMTAPNMDGPRRAMGGPDGTRRRLLRRRTRPSRSH